MKKTYAILLFIAAFINNFALSQSALKAYKAGHEFNVSLPEYMTKTVGLNDVAIFQYQNIEKDVYGFIIEDNKEDLKLAELSFTSINEFYDEFMKDFLVDAPKRKASKPKLIEKGGIKFITADLTYYEQETAVTIYYSIGIVETKSAYYKVLSWCTEENKDTFEKDFEKIVFSLND